MGYPQQYPQQTQSQPMISNMPPSYNTDASPASAPPPPYEEPSAPPPSYESQIEGGNVTHN